MTFQSTQPTSREQVREDLRTMAVGREVFHFGSGLAWVAEFNTPICTDGTELIHDHGWAIGGVYFNEKETEIALFAFPIGDMI